MRTTAKFAPKRQRLPLAAFVGTGVGFVIWLAALPLLAVVFPPIEQAADPPVEMRGAEALLTTIVPIFWLPIFPILGLVFNIMMVAALVYAVRGLPWPLSITTTVTFACAAIAVWGVPWLLDWAYQGARVGAYVWAASYTPLGLGYVISAIAQRVQVRAAKS